MAGASDGFDVAAALAGVRGRIEVACARAGRGPGEVTLVGVSKGQPLERLHAALAEGLADLGESYAQALRDRAAAIAGPPGAPVRWHFLGALQRNKARYVARVATAFHALERVDDAVELGRRRLADGLPPLACFVQVNLAGETTKAGVPPAGAGELVDAAGNVDGVEVAGLMAMPPLAERPEDSRRWFAELRNLAERLGVPGLSMGTTSDFEVAVEEGATHVRVGTAIFGPRDPRDPR